MEENLINALLGLSSRDQVKNKTTIDKLPTEEIFDQQQYYKEGKIVEVFVNRFERNHKARIECIKHYGDSCFICNFNFGNFYGDSAKGFIHVHHKRQLSDIGEEYEVDPINDLIPLCANCHSVIHLAKPMLSIEHLKKTTKKSGN